MDQDMCNWVDIALSTLFAQFDNISVWLSSSDITNHLTSSSFLTTSTLNVWYNCISGKNG